LGSANDVTARARCRFGGVWKLLVQRVSMPPDPVP
jgi:hypothetical protein